MDLLSVIGQHVTPGMLDQIGEQIGATPQQTQAGLAAALPALLGGLARNTATPQGAANLDQALERDHDGGLLEGLGGLLGGGGSPLGGGGGALGALGGLLGGGGAMGALGGLLGGSRATDGAGILGHILGGRQGAVEEGVSRASGLGRGQVLQLLMLAAPLVMSALGKMKRQQGLDAQGVAQVVDREQREVAQQVPGNRGGLMGMLDRDDDGSIADDVAQIGTALGGAFLLSRMGRR